MTAPVIAVLDNDPSFLSLMHDLLSEDGYAPLLWHLSAQLDPHALLRQVQPALVILDVWIERRDDGWELLKRLWGDAETTHIPAVILTGEPTALRVCADLLRVMHCQVVRKPFDLQDLLGTIATALASPAHQDRRPHLHERSSADRSMTIQHDSPLTAVAEDA